MGAFNAWLSVLEWCGKSRWYGRYRENWGQAATDWMWPTAPVGEPWLNSR
jgi:hypothetical protein